MSTPLTIESASGWVWDDAAKTLLRAIVKFEELPDAVPYTFTQKEWPDAWATLTGNPSISPFAPPDGASVAFIPVSLLRQRVEKLGLWDDFAAYLMQTPAEMLKVLTLESGVDPAYPAITAAFDAMNVPQAARNYILATPSAGAPDVQLSA